MTSQIQQCFCDKTEVDLGIRLVDAATTDRCQMSENTVNLKVVESQAEAEFYTQYNKGQLICHGGYGSVYRGTRIADNTSVALKFIPNTKVTNWAEENNMTVPLEVVMLRKVENVRGVIKLLDVWQLDDQFVLVMYKPDDYIDLEEHIKSCGSLSEERSEFFLKQLVSTLIDVQAAGVLHRDIKAENLLIEKNVDGEELRLLDFGSATYWTDEPYTKTDGTLLYHPPEYFLCRKYQAGSATAWMLGILLYYMIYGKLPFTQWRHIVQTNVAPSGAISRDLRDLLRRCLSKRPEHRPSMHQILQHPWLSTSVNSLDGLEVHTQWAAETRVPVPSSNY